MKKRKSIDDVFNQRQALVDRIDDDLANNRIGLGEYTRQLNRINNAAYSMTDRMNAEGRKRFGGAVNNPDYKYSYNTRMGINNR